MSRQQPLTTSSHVPHGSIQRRSWVKTAVAFVPFITLVLGSWLYAIHLDRLANQSMVRSKESSAAPPTNHRNTQTTTDSLGAGSASRDDDIVIGDSKDNVFYFVQVRARTKKTQEEGEYIIIEFMPLLLACAFSLHKEHTTARPPVPSCSILRRLPPLPPYFQCFAVGLFALTIHSSLLLFVSRSPICTSAHSGKRARPIFTHSCPQPCPWSSLPLWSLRAI